MIKRLILFFFSIISLAAFSQEQIKFIYNPFTGRMDAIRSDSIVMDTYAKMKVDDVTIDTNASGQAQSKIWDVNGTNVNNLNSGDIGIGKLPYSKLDIAGTAKSNDFITQSRFYKSIVTFSFDDGHITNYETMYPLFQAKGIGATENVVINWVGDATRMTWLQLQDLVDAGWEISGHSLDHTNMTEITSDAAETDMKATKDSLANHGFDVTTMAWPYSAFNDSVRNIARKYYRGVRASLNSRDSIMSGVHETYALVGTPCDVVADSAKFRALIDRLYEDGGWVIFYIHDTDAADSLMLSNLIDYIQARDIPILTTDSALNLIGNQVDISKGLSFRNTDMRLDGTIYRGIGTYLHTYKPPDASGLNQFYGVNAGNFTMSAGGGATSLASYNLGIGYEVLNDLTTGYMNIALGFRVMDNATTSYRNTSVGYEAGGGMIDANNNVKIGYQAGISNTTGDENIYIGSTAGYSQTGNGNIYIGYLSGNGTVGESTASNNTSVGTESMKVNKDGGTNTAFGYRTLYSNLTGDGNAAFGNYAMRNNTGNLSSAFGDRAMYFGTGGGNTFIGNVSGYGATGASNGTYNTSLGIESLYSYTTADQSVAVGGSALKSTTTGDYNTALGYQAGFSNQTGASNIFIGYQAGYSETGSNKLYISNNNTASPLIKGDFTAMSLNVFGVLYTGKGTIADNDSTPSVAAGNTFVYTGNANSVTIDALDDHIVGAYYTIFGNSATYTITIPDASVAGGDSFNLSGNWVGGVDDCITLYCISADTFKEVSRSDN